MAHDPMILDLFAGFGWAEGLTELGLDEVGVELDPDACRTRVNLGHATIRADAATLPLGHLRPLDGLIASPPCPTFSNAGGKAGRRLIDEIAAAIRDTFNGADPLDHVPAMARILDDPDHPGRGDQLAHESALTAQPARYAHALRPRWILLEQVPSVLPLWHVYVEQLRAVGYSAWAGVVCAADYGVPQTRHRAVLLASLDRPVTAPPTTHGDDPAPGLFGTLEPWVTMADALPDLTGALVDRRSMYVGGAPTAPTFDCDTQPAPTVTGQAGAGGVWQIGFPRRDDLGTSPDGYRERDWHGADGPAPVVTEKARSWQFRAGTPIGVHRPTRRPLDEPAPTIAFGNDMAGWVFERPATTIAGDHRLWPPGHKINGDDERRLGVAEAAERYGNRAGTDAIRLEHRHALALQSFGPHVEQHLAGTRTSRFRQIGNAVPPLLAAHLAAAVTGRPLA